MITDGDKLFVIVRSDLKPGQQMAQMGHALSEFWVRYYKLAKEWHDLSNYICVLSIENESELADLLSKAETKRIPCAHFREPDYADALTAIAIHPTGKGLVKDLKLAFSQ